jgi:predicted CXXCH cytochrome family protein
VRSLQILLLLAALPLEGQSHREYVGAQACAKCHATAAHESAASLHGKMLQPATQQSVEGNFGAGHLDLHGATYSVERADGKFYVTESELSGKPWKHQVDFALGSRRVQHYLTTLPDGRIVVLPTTWDVLRKTWVHNLDIENPEETNGPEIQVWNKACYGCHVSGEKKNFDLANLSYHTTWRGMGVDCETCHGPGSEHVQAASAQLRPPVSQGPQSPHGPLNADARARIRQSIINPARLDPLPSSMVCAQCHSFRDIYSAGFKAGENYSDYFLPIMQYALPSQDSAYWPDGRPRWVSNETLGMWQSQCFLKGGATCTTCHSQPHDVDVAKNSQLAAGNNALCLSCHKAIAADVPSHTHHAANSSGSSCVECHMPRIVLSLRTEMRDHSISIPVPENTIRHNVPNACNLCHQDKDPNWALQKMNEWYGDKSRQKWIQRADAFSGAAAGDLSAVPALLQILGDKSQGSLIRANAAGYLGSFPDDPSAYAAVLQSFSDSEPLVRLTAASAIRPRAAQRADVAPRLALLLRDPGRIVQVTAALGLVSMGVQKVPGEDEEWFENAKQIYRTRAELDSDDAQQELAAGRFDYLSGDMDGAVAAFRATLKLDDHIPAQYYLARALTEKGEYQSAQQILNTIPPNDPQYTLAQRLLTDLESRQPSKAQAEGNSANSAAEKNFRDGQTLYQNGNYGGALKPLEEALSQAPQAPWATKARIYRAICLEKLSRLSEAEAAMQALSVNSATREDADFQLAYVELLYESGRSDEALKRVDAFIAAVPKSPTAYFWRAKVLMQLQRTDEAATAAEESVRLLPQDPAAHNLLIRIYQKLGRTADAAEQMEWVRDYERRMQSR